MAAIKQQSFHVGSEKVTIVSQAKTRQGNLCGWNVDINGVRYFAGVIRRSEAVDRSFAKWVRQFK